MASKKDLVEAQSFSRRRLLTAFTSGSVGNIELEPAKPLRAVVVGLSLTALVVVGGIFYGFLARGLPQDWTDNHVILDKTTGARYVSHDSVLYPVANTASARLLIPTDYTVITTTSNQLKNIRIGPAVGIPGAPDQIPNAADLTNTGWTACLQADGSTDLAIHRNPIASATDAAVVVRDSTGTAFVVVGQYRYEVSPENEAPVLRALGLGNATVRTVNDRWVNLFLPGSRLAPIVVQDAGNQVAGSPLQIGMVVHQTGDPAEWRYLVLPDGSVTQLSPVAYQLYLLGTGTQLGEVRDVSAADLRDRPNGVSPVVPADWPTSIPTQLDPDFRACALTTSNRTDTSTTFAAAQKTDPETPIVDSGTGALVRAVGRGDESAGTIYLIDATGTAFPVDPASDALTRLGYSGATDLGDVDAVWIDLFPVGSRLSVAAAGTVTSTVPTP